MFFPLNCGRNCDYNELLAASGSGIFTFDYKFPYLYVVDMGTGPTYNGILYIYNVADPTGPVLLSTTALPAVSAPRKPKIRGDVLYIPYKGGDGGTGTYRSLALWNVANRSSPALLGTCDLTYMLPYHPMGVALEGDYAYVPYGPFTTIPGRVDKIDVSDPTTPTIVDSLTSINAAGAGCFDIHVNDGTVFVSGTFGGSSAGFLASVDTATMNLIQFLSNSRLQIPGRISMWADGSYAYMSENNSAELWTVNTSNPASMSQASLVSMAPTTGVSTGYEQLTLLIEETNRLYVGRPNGGTLCIVILDVSTPTTPSVTGFINTSGEAVSDMAKIDGCAGFVWGQGTGAAMHLLGTAPLS